VPDCAEALFAIFRIMVRVTVKNDKNACNNDKNSQ